jgi:hypothetical protein
MLALARGEADAPTLTALARGLAARYPNVQLFPDLAGLANLWVRRCRWARTSRSRSRTRGSATATTG